MQNNRHGHLIHHRNAKWTSRKCELIHKKFHSKSNDLKIWAFIMLKYFRRFKTVIGPDWNGKIIFSGTVFLR